MKSFDVSISCHFPVVPVQRAQKHNNLIGRQTKLMSDAISNYKHAHIVTVPI